MSIPTISAEHLQRLDPGQGIILDVRTTMEHAEKHLTRPHQHVPLDTLNPDDFVKKHALDHTISIYLLCRTGQRATLAAKKFLEQGYNNILVVEEGIVACETCNYEIEGYSKKNLPYAEAKAYPIPLERQVRIAAGSFVAIGAALTLFINMWFCLIPLFVGCGLIFAGITDRCGMALILTKAPWNKLPTSDSGGR